MAKQAVKSIDEVQLGFQLPPPIYCDHLTTVPHVANKNIKLVKSLVLDGEGLLVEGIEGQQYNIPVNNIKYWK
jgi:hypothetical protein